MKIENEKVNENTQEIARLVELKMSDVHINANLIVKWNDVLVEVERNKRKIIIAVGSI